MREKMKRRKSESSMRKWIYLSIVVVLLYLFTVTRTELTAEKQVNNAVFHSFIEEDELQVKYDAVHTERRMTEHEQPLLSTLIFEGIFENISDEDCFSGIPKSAIEAFESGKSVWRELESAKPRDDLNQTATNRTKTCLGSISLSGPAFLGRWIELQCGLTLGSHITLVGTPRKAQPVISSTISRSKKGSYTMVSQFMVELRGLRTAESEEPPRILHFNPRLDGDYSGKPVIEQNTCYRMHWGNALRCEGLESNDDEATVDGEVKCEKWSNHQEQSDQESMKTWWLNRLVGKTDKVNFEWSFPFSVGKLFVLTLRTGLEGYHVNVDGRHITSFPYTTGFTLEDATGLFINGDIDVQSIFAASLPISQSSYKPDHIQLLEMSNNFTVPPPLFDGRSVEMLIGILSTGHHFTERMTIRKTWMQHPLIKSSKVVVRFFLALHTKKEVNLVVKKEAEFFRDIVIVPYMDNYNLVVLKTIAIAEYGVHVVGAKYIMKGDDDTFVRLDPIREEIKKVVDKKSFYMGNINFKQKVLRDGKWGVTFKEWPGNVYPPYANGPGYIVTSDIARFIVSEFKKHKLRLFKMEDVSMGMWVEQFNKSSSKPVEYVHNEKFCQPGCIEDYYTAHYQSPRQIICLWKKLQNQQRPQCCSGR